MSSQEKHPVMSSPHDAVFRRILGKPGNAASQLRSTLPMPLLDRLDLTRLERCPGSFVDAALRWRHSDLLFTVPLDGRRAFIYVLEEHQRKNDPWMAFRMLRYMVRIWDRYLEEHCETAKRLPVVLPIVVYQGDREWTGSTELLDLLDTDADTEGMLEYLPRFEFLLQDLTYFDEKELRQRAFAPPVRLLYLLLRIAAGNPRIDDELRPWAEELNKTLRLQNDNEDFVSLVSYIEAVSETPTDRLGDLFAELGPEAKEAYVTTADMLRAEGDAKGEAKGRAEALVQIMTIKFGILEQSVLDRVYAASIEQIELWTNRVLTAETLDDVLR